MFLCKSLIAEKLCINLKMNKINHNSITNFRWKDNIKMDLREVGGEGGGIDWIDLAQDRDRWWALVYTVMNLQVP
jgi:hypothetical protein